MIIPWQDLDPETLMNVLESFVLREGTDYGEYEVSLESKKQQLLAQLQADKIVIVWSELHQSIDIKEKTSFLGSDY